MQLASMAIEHRSRGIHLRRLLMRHYLPSIKLMNLETIISEIDGHGAHLGGDLSIAPAVEDTAGVRTEGDDVPKDLELWEGLVDFDMVGLPVAFYCCCEAAETCLIVNCLILGGGGWTGWSDLRRRLLRLFQWEDLELRWFLL
jgi:hypothetical protein